MAIRLLYMVGVKHSGPRRKLLKTSELLGVAPKTKMKLMGIQM
jgi:hypothetical protein